LADENLSPPVAVAQRHLASLRALLRRDYLTDVGWTDALRETAEMAREALGASEALVAIHDGKAGSWEAWTSRGERVGHEAIHVVASLSILDQVRTSGEPILTTATSPLLVRSHSVRAHEMHSVLAVPLRWWRRGGSDGPLVGGCLYADRRRGAEPFADSDVDLVLDLSRLAERTLSLLRHLSVVEQRLDACRGEVDGLRVAAAATYRVGHYESRDRSFAESIQAPLRRAARADKVGLLLLGPTGSGKSHLAQAFHYESGRRNGPFVVLDCGQVTSAEALAAELFGFASRSGFSAPTEGRIGKARMADGGTLFVDEISCLPLELQQRLLRLIQTGRFSPLGSAEEASVDLQIVAAANQDLAELVQRGGFREDLFWRISEITVRLPSLDERPDDIAGFADAFLAAARERFQRCELRGFTPAAYAALRAVRWSERGNIRGLEHTVNRSVLLAPDGVSHLDVADLVFQIGPCAVQTRPCLSPIPLTVPPTNRRPQPHDPAVSLLAAKITEHRGNIARLAADSEVVAAIAPGAPALAPSTLRLRIRQLGLDGELAGARELLTPALAEIRAALLAHGDAGAAAASLGITRDSLVWQLRRAGLSVRKVLAERRS